MSQASLSIASVASPSGKRKISEVTGSPSVDPSPKFSKTNSNKVVPTVVAVDMGGPPAQKQPPQQANVAGLSVGAVTAASKERAVATRVDWKLVNTREALDRILNINKMNPKGAAYISVDTQAYKELTGLQLQLGEYNHFKTRGPYMLNIWGISSQEVGGNVSHSVAFDTKDGSKDYEVQEFAQFVALMDDVILDKCVALAINTPEIRSSVQWVDFCKNDETGEINMKKLREVVAKNYFGGLRTSKNAKNKPEFAPISFDANTGLATINDAYFFKTKIRGKRTNANLLDLSCFTKEGNPVFHGLVKELEEERATYLQSDFEVPAINFVGKVFYSTWITRKVKYQLKPKGGAEATEATDMDGNIIPQSHLDMVARQEQEYLAQRSAGVPEGMVVQEDDGGFLA